MGWEGWTQTSEEILALPLDELGMRVLQDVAGEQQAGVQSNRRNWLLGAAQHGPYGQAEGPVLRALSEAWQWLLNSGLVSYRMNGDEWIFITRRGLVALAGGAAVVRAAERLSVDLHARIESKVRRQYLMGEYELAAFAAMREVEIAVREAAGASGSLIGVKLMRQALGDGGVLRDADLDPGEQVAMMELFAGAIGLFKNPSSHRQVDYSDPTEAAEVILFADLLLRVLDRIKR